MSDNIIEITENTNYSITVDTSLIQNDNNIVIEISNPNSIDIINNSIISVNDLPVGYPLEWTVGNLPISRVSGLDLIGMNGIDVVNNSGVYTISTTGLQPSGNYSLVGHNHISSDITDFNNAVSGLIPPSNFTSLIGVSGIIVSNSGTNYTVSLTDPTIQLSDITDLSSNSRTFLLTPSSSNLLTLVTDETGSGFLVFNDGPAFSGIPTAPTAPSGTNNTQIANTSFVRTEISNLVNSAPNTLDTLNELATALGNDPNFSTTISNSLASKAALNGAIFIGSVTIPSGTGNFNSLTVNSIDVSLSGHLHSASDITNFNSGVSGLLPSITGSSYISTSFNNNTIISARL